MSQKFFLINKTKSKIPNLPFKSIKNKILGKDYLLSIVFIHPQQSQELNKKYRKKNKSTNILSFPLSKNEGEILLCLKEIKSQLKAFDKNLDQMLVFLVIHGMLHLKGMQHSAKMEREEKKILSFFKF
jgi:probable rRNA maturation factor